MDRLLSEICSNLRSYLDEDNKSNLLEVGIEIKKLLCKHGGTVEIDSSYYDNNNGLTTKDIIINTYGAKNYRYFCIGNIIKYLTRFNKKNKDPRIDLTKAYNYYNMLIELL